MSQLRFDNKVVVITGAGRAIGRAYAVFFAERGAKVLVNDNGCNIKGEGEDKRFAEEVVALIKSKGGVAVANFDSVVDGDKIIKAAVEYFGTVDILINNAGILKDVSFVKMSDDDFDQVVKCHLYGTFKTCRAAWNIMREKGFGRIINTSSGSGLYGAFGQVNYSAAKMGILGLSTTLAKEGEKRNVLTNVVIPVAASRMTETIMPPDVLENIKPEFIVPLVAYLCHEKTKENGGVYELSGGFVSKMRWQRTQGVLFDIPNFNAEDIEPKWNDIISFERNNEYPTTSADTLNKINENIDRMEALNAAKPKL